VAGSGGRRRSADGPRGPARLTGPAGATGTAREKIGMTGLGRNKEVNKKLFL
jgi:hypothetical protein